MTTTQSLPADATAERIVRHFQAEGFAGITEALLVRIRLKKGDRMAVDAAFEFAIERQLPPPMQEFFQIQPYGFFSGIRTFADAKAVFASDFGRALRVELPRIFFDEAPVYVDDAMATDTKYDAMLKIGDNTDGYAVAVLLNDPNSSFFEYLNAQTGYDWREITSGMDAAVKSLSTDVDLI